MSARGLRSRVVSAFELERISGSGERQNTALAALAALRLRALEHPHQLAFADDGVLLLRRNVGELIAVRDAVDFGQLDLAGRLEPLDVLAVRRPA